MTDKDFDQPEFSIEKSDDLVQYEPETIEVEQDKEKEKEQEDKVEETKPKRRGRPKSIPKPKKDVEVVIGVQCPVCGARLKKPGWAGKTKKCPNCSHEVSFHSIIEIVKE